MLLLLLLLWVTEKLYGFMQKWVLVSSFVGGGEVSVWIVSIDTIVIILAAFVLCWVIPATQDTFCWRVPSLIAIFVIMRATTFDTRVGFVAVRSCVSVLLTSYTLWDVFPVRSVRFNVDNLILNGRYIVYVYYC
jgi:hypothetical protein